MKLPWVNRSLYELCMWQLEHERAEREAERVRLTRERDEALSASFTNARLIPPSELSKPPTQQRHTFTPHTLSVDAAARRLEARSRMLAAGKRMQAEAEKDPKA
jgi:hypothetical protein